MEWWKIPVIVVGVVYAVSGFVAIGEIRRVCPTWPYWNKLYQIITRPIGWAYDRLNPPVRS